MIFLLLFISPFFAYSSHHEVGPFPPSHLVFSKKKPRSFGIIKYNKKKASPGLTLVTGFRDNLPSLWLMRLDGQILHSWKPRIKEIFPRQNHVKGRKKFQSDWSNYIHGAILLKDGSVIFNYERAGLVKMDLCGKVLWKLKKMTHHSVETLPDQTLWVSGLQLKTQWSVKYPELQPPYFSPTALHIGKNGKVIKEIPLLDVFYKNNLQGMILSHWNGQPKGPQKPFDWAHLNDVEIVSKKAGQSSKVFQAGDIMVSLREMNLIMIFDPINLKVRWHHTGPWVGQHDPDIEANGHILVYNNRPELKSSSLILSINPKNNNIKILYGGAQGEFFKSKIKGKIQRLANNNLLITEYSNGRIFEVNSQKELVWEFINSYEQKYLASVEQAIRYDKKMTAFLEKPKSCDNL